MKFLVPVLLMAAGAFAQSCDDLALELSTDCMVVVTSGDDADGCAKLYSEKCQTLINNPSAFGPCKDNELIKSAFTDDVIAALKLGINAYCSKDGSGKKCPVVDFASLTNLETENLVKDSCPSKTCSNALAFYLDYAEANGLGDETFTAMKKELTSDNCVKQQKDDTNSAAGGAPGGAAGGPPATGGGAQGTPTGGAGATGTATGTPTATNNDTSDARFAAKIGGSLLLTLLLSLAFF